MSAFEEWHKRICACVHPNAHECYSSRNAPMDDTERSGEVGNG